MSEKLIPSSYLKDIAAMAAALNDVDGKGSYLWLTGTVSLTDGEAIYTLVNEDDQWWLDPDLTQSAPEQE